MSKVKFLVCDCYLARLERIYSDNNITIPNSRTFFCGCDEHVSHKMLVFVYWFFQCVLRAKLWEGLDLVSLKRCNCDEFRPYEICEFCHILYSYLYFIFIF